MDEIPSTIDDYTLILWLLDTWNCLIDRFCPWLTKLCPFYDTWWKVSFYSSYNKFLSSRMFTTNVNLKFEVLLNNRLKEFETLAKKLKCLVMLESSTNYELFRVLRLCLNIVLTARDSQAHILSSWIAKSSLSSKIHRQKKGAESSRVCGAIKIRTVEDREGMFLYLFIFSLREMHFLSQKQMQYRYISISLGLKSLFHRCENEICIFWFPPQAHWDSSVDYIIISHIWCERHMMARHRILHYIALSHLPRISPKLYAFLFGCCFLFWKFKANKFVFVTSLFFLAQKVWKILQQQIAFQMNFLLFHTWFDCLISLKLSELIWRAFQVSHLSKAHAVKGK